MGALRAERQPTVDALDVALDASREATATCTPAGSRLRTADQKEM
jgi:hypothetical protein